MLNEPMSSSSTWSIPTDYRSEFRRAESPAGGTSAVDSSRMASWAPRVALAMSGTLAQAARSCVAPLGVALLVGGVSLAPALTLLAVVSLFLPFDALRSAAPALIDVSLAWLMIAIFGAHAFTRRRHSPRDVTDGADQ